MKEFMGDDFLLSTPEAKKLFHEYAEHTPILDYHCHISPQEIAENRQFKNITEVWLGGDHYKWRQMRSNGVEEYYITGNASDREKFQKWAETLEKSIGNPLYHWSHLELRRYFGYDGFLNGETAEKVWNLCNEKLKQPDMSVRGLIRRSNVRLICTTDDPIDDLYWHQVIRKDKSFEVKVLPAWRPDKINNLEKDSYLAYLQKLSDVSGVVVTDLFSLKEAVLRRMDYFVDMGCVVTDHALNYIYYAPASEEEVYRIFADRLNGNIPSEHEQEIFKTYMMQFFAREYHKRNMVMQIHFGCKRDNNSRMFKMLGPDTGFDCINNYTPSATAAEFLDSLAAADELPKTILYSLNPNDNAYIGSLIGCFQEAGAREKIQQGSAWWFNDHIEGMRTQLISLANLGLLSNFVGMLTDSRSFLSYTRHEYFRRILCELIGGWVEDGQYPDDEKALKGIIQGISYNNAICYFGFPLEIYKD